MCYVNIFSIEDYEIHQKICENFCLCKKIFFEENPKSVVEITSNLLIVKEFDKGIKYVYNLIENNFRIYKVNFDKSTTRDKYLILFDNDPDIIDIETSQKKINPNFEKNFNKFGNILNLININKKILLEENHFDKIKSNFFLNRVQNVYLESFHEYSLTVRNLEEYINDFYNQVLNNFKFDQLFGYFDKDFSLFHLNNFSKDFDDFAYFKKHILNSDKFDYDLNYELFDILYYLKYLYVIKSQKTNQIIENRNYFNRKEVINETINLQNKNNSKNDLRDYFQIKQIIINPSTIIISSKNYVHSNRFLRKYFFDDNFIKVNFKSLFGDKLQTNSNRTNKLEMLYKIIKDNGLTIFNRQYEFFFYSTTNLRANSIWMIHKDAFKNKNFEMLKLKNKEDLYLDLGLRIIAPNYHKENQTDDSFKDTINLRELKNPKKLHIFEDKSFFKNKNYDFNNIPIQKIISNLSLNFSSSIEINLFEDNDSPIYIELYTESDIKSNSDTSSLDDKCINYILSDGCGKISPDLMKLVCEKYNNNFIVSAIQIRYDGKKGVLGNYDNLDGFKIVFVDSMIKFNGEINNKLELITFSRLLRGNLNIQIILILLLRKFSITFFLKLFKKKQLKLLKGECSLFKKILNKANRLINESSYKYNKPKKNGDPSYNKNCDFSNEREINYPKHIKNETNEKIEIPNLNSITNNIYIYYNLIELISKCKINLKKSCYLMGIIDFYGILEENEIFIQISHPKRGDYIIKNEVLILKNPVYSITDIKLIKCVDSDFLRKKFKDVVVFPSKGKFSIPASLSNSDLDGDFYQVIYEKSFIKEFKRTEKNKILKSKKKFFNTNFNQKIYNNDNLDKYKWTSDFNPEKRIFERNIISQYIPPNNIYKINNRLEINTLKFNNFSNMNFEDNIFEYFLFYNRLQKVSYVNDKYFSELFQEMKHKIVKLKENINKEESDYYYEKLLEENNIFEIKANIEIDFSKKGITTDCFRGNIDDEEKKFFNYRKNKFNLLKPIDFNEILNNLGNLNEKFCMYKSQKNYLKENYEGPNQNILNLIDSNNINNFKQNKIVHSKNSLKHEEITHDINDFENLIVDKKNNNRDTNFKDSLVDKKTSIKIPLVTNIFEFFFPYHYFQPNFNLFNSSEKFCKYLIGLHTEYFDSNLDFKYFFTHHYNYKYLRKEEYLSKKKFLNESSYLDLITDSLNFGNNNHSILEISNINSFISSVILFLDYDIECKKKSNFLSRKVLLEDLIKIIENDNGIKELLMDIYNIIKEYSKKIKCLMNDKKLVFESELIFIDLVYPSKNLVFNKTDVYDWRKLIKIQLRDLNETYFMMLKKNLDKLKGIHDFFKDLNKIVELLELLVFSQYMKNLLIEENKNENQTYNLIETPIEYYLNSINFLDLLLNKENGHSNFFKYQKFLEITKIYGLYLYSINMLKN